MSVFAAGNPAPRRPTWRVRALRTPSPGASRALLVASFVRLGAVLAVGTFALARFLELVVAPPRGAIAAQAAGAAATGLLAIAAGRMRPRAARWALTALAVLVAVVASLLAAGLPARLLGLRHWGDLLSALGSGFSALPALNVPYDGVNDWARTALVLSGGALLAVAALAATWPRPSGRGARGVAVLALSVLFAVPAIELTGAHPWLSGAVFGVGIGAVLHAERLPRRRIPAALGAFGVAVLLAMWLAPGLDRATPIVDVQALASRLQPTSSVAFSWNHRYGPLNWPRDGREVLRVRARVGAYWKAETLDDFDGRFWRGVPTDPSGIGGRDTEFSRRHADWLQTIGVTVRALRITQFPAAGTTLRIDRAPRVPIPGTRGAFVSATGPLLRGDAYQAQTYVARPSRAEMQAAGTDYPPFVVANDLSMKLPATRRDTFNGGLDQVIFPAWQTGGAPVAYRAEGIIEQRSDLVLGRSAYGAMYRLSRRLAARALSPYDYVHAVERFFATGGFVYDETPATHKYALPAFVLRDKHGYCQQFSGAMALLLRMGGVPARVASGFSPGTFDRGSGDYVVRDTDAHSWVEVYFPGLGWVTFDPTPSIAPARSQLASAPVAQRTPDVKPLKGPSKTKARARADVGVTAHATPTWRRPLVVAGALVLLLALAIGAWMAAEAWRRRGVAAADATLAELERALRRAGRPPRPGTTLADLERTLGGSDDATGYLRAVRDARFRGGDRAPTPEERRALRRALGEGLGATGRIRALWALPPQAPSRLPRPRGRGRRVH